MMIDLVYFDMYLVDMNNIQKNQLNYQMNQLNMINMQIEQVQ